MTSRRRRWCVFILALAAAGFRLGTAAQAKSQFRASRVEGRGSEPIFCDLDGDGLKDLVLVGRTNLTIYFQDKEKGFSKEPDLEYGLEEKPALIWAAALGRNAESLMLMTADGVAELRCANRKSAPLVESIIRQPTSVPGVLDPSNNRALSFPLSARTRTQWPLLLVPVGNGLQVWQHGEGWKPAQVLAKTVEARLAPIVGEDPGFTQNLILSASVSDINGDGRDDLLVVRPTASGSGRFEVYLQETNGLFGTKPALTLQEKPDRRSWMCFADLNRDGKVDLVRTTWLDDPWFVLGMKSGKVLVRVYLANQRGELSAEPQQVFRKNDWTPAVPVLDMDGDGFPDLVLGYSLFDSREGVRKMMVAKQIDFSLKFHFFRPGSGYPKEADFERDLLIHLDRHSLILSWTRRELFARFINLSGDFNGDGKRDLLVRDHSDQVCMYPFVSRTEGFSTEPELHFVCPEPIESMETQDLNGDGVSDLIIKVLERDAFWIFLSEGRRD